LARGLLTPKLVDPAAGLSPVDEYELPLTVAEMLNVVHPVIVVVTRALIPRKMQFAGICVEHVTVAPLKPDC
jgi:hypothetical protein